jgi:DNA invertase Pin-like site-specific DNA recombinase
MAEGRYVSYLRVSTDKQGRSGLGLEAQRKAVEDFLNGAGAGGSSRSSWRSRAAAMTPAPS